MQDASHKTTDADGPKLVLRRVYPVAPAQVWRAWTDPQALARWWGPGPVDSVTSAVMDVRVGGRYRIAFLAPDGVEHEAFGEYLEVVPNRRLVFTWARRGMPEIASRVSVDLQAVDGGTELRFVHAQFPDVAARDDHEIGWLPTFVKLGELLLQA